MRRLEHAVIAILLAALAALSYVHFRAPRPAANVAKEDGAPAVPPPKGPLPDEPAAGATADEKQRQPEIASPREDSGDEARARAYAEEQNKDRRDAEQAQFDALLDLAKKLIQDGGVEALLWAGCQDQKGSGNDDDLRRLVAAYEKETDPARLWALAQRIHFHLTDERGHLWSIDHDAYVAFEKWGREGEDPFKRGFALGSAGSTGWGDKAAFNRDRMMNDADEKVRAKAAGQMPAPKGISAEDARPVADRFLELLRSPDANVRASAAAGFGPWAFRAEDVEALVRAATADASADVRAAAVRSLAMNGSDRAKEVLAAIAKDLSQPAAVRDAAREGLAKGGIVPEGVRVIRADTK